MDPNSCYTFDIILLFCYTFLHLFSFKTPFVLRLNNKIYKYYTKYLKYHIILYMSSYKGFRTGSNSYGQFWFGGSSFPGFLYKKMLGLEVVEVHNLLLEELLYVTNLLNYGINIRLVQESVLLISLHDVLKWFTQHRVIIISSAVVFLHN